jgi:hypothetical protein
MDDQTLSLPTPAPGSTLSPNAPAFVPSAPTATPSKIEANVHKLIAAGMSDAAINARLASTAARHGMTAYQFNSSQLAVFRSNYAANKSSATASSSKAAQVQVKEEQEDRPVRPIPAKPLSMRGGAKAYMPEQAKVPKTKEEKENSRRLIVVLSKVSFDVSSFGCLAY